MAVFEFNCPYCGKPLSAEDEWRGMATDCPECLKKITIPLKAAAAVVSSEVRIIPDTFPGKIKMMLSNGFGKNRKNFEEMLPRVLFFFGIYNVILGLIALLPYGDFYTSRYFCPVVGAGIFIFCVLAGIWLKKFFIIFNHAIDSHKMKISSMEIFNILSVFYFAGAIALFIAAFALCDMENYDFWSIISGGVYLLFLGLTAIVPECVSVRVDKKATLIHDLATISVFQFKAGLVIFPFIVWIILYNSALALFISIFSPKYLCIGLYCLSPIVIGCIFALPLSLYITFLLENFIFDVAVAIIRIPGLLSGISDKLIIGQKENK